MKDNLFSRKCDLKHSGAPCKSSRGIICPKVGTGNVFTAKKSVCKSPRQKRTEVAGSDFVCSARESNKQKEGKKYEISFWEV